MKQATSEAATSQEISDHTLVIIVAMIILALADMNFQASNRKEELGAIRMYASDAEARDAQLQTALRHRDDLFINGKPVPALNYTGPGVKGRWISTDPQAMLDNGDFGCRFSYRRVHCVDGIEDEGMNALFFEPVTVESGTPLDFGALLTSKIHGYAIEKDGKILIPLIWSLEEGQGHVGRFLDSLSPRCVIPNVTSERLRGMLDRRGWTPYTEANPDGPCTIYQRVQQ